MIRLYLSFLTKYRFLYLFEKLDHKREFVGCHSTQQSIQPRLIYFERTASMMLFLFLNSIYYCNWSQKLFSITAIILLLQFNNNILFSFFKCRYTIMAWTFWLLPTLFGLKNYAYSSLGTFAYLPLIAFELVFAIQLTIKYFAYRSLNRKFLYNKKLIVAFMIFIAAAWISVFRSSLAGNIPLGRAFLAVLCSSLATIIIVLQIITKVWQGKTVWGDLVLGLFIYSTINLFSFFVLGIKSPSGNLYIRELETTLHFLEYRIYFPFTHSARSFSIEMGILFTICCGLLLSQKRDSILKTFFFLGCAICGFACMLLSDGRIPFAFSLIGIVYLLFKSLSIRFPVFIILALIALPFLFSLFVSTNVDLLIYDFKLYSLSGRLPIWAYLGNKIISPSNYFTYLVGFGAEGQKTSKYVYEYALQFSDYYTNIESTAAHNSVLQLFMDQGLLGIGVFISLLISATVSIKQKGSKMIVAFAVLAYLVATAGTETSISIYYESILVIFSICILSLAFDNANQVSLSKT